MQFISEHTLGTTVGGKAKNLFILKEVGINVPHFVVIPQEELLTIISKESAIEQQLKAIVNFTISEAFLEQVVQQFKDVRYFAVRSSAIDEDSVEFSFA